MRDFDRTEAYAHHRRSIAKFVSASEISEMLLSFETCAIHIRLWSKIKASFGLFDPPLHVR